MTKESLEKLNVLVDALSVKTVLLDLTIEEDRQEFDGMLAAIQEAAQQEKLNNLGSLVELLRDHARRFDPDKGAAFGKKITAGISIVQAQWQYDFKQTGQAQDVSAMKAAFAQIEQGVSTEKTGLSSMQLNEIPDYISNTLANLEDVERDVFALEKNTADEEKIHAVFRAFHTIKGESGLLGALPVAQLAHEVESLLEKVRAKQIVWDAEIGDQVLEISDAIKNILQMLKDDITKGLAVDTQGPIQQISDLLKKKTTPDVVSPAPSPAATPPAQPAPEAEKPSAVEEFVPKIPKLNLPEDAEIFPEFIAESRDHMTSAEESLLSLEANPSNDDDINKAFREFHTVKGLASFLNLDDMRILAHDTETMMDYVRKGTLPMSSVVAEAALAAVDGIRKLLDLLAEQVANQGQLTSPYFIVTDIVRRIREINHQVASGQAATPPKPKIGEILVEKNVVTEADVASALAIQQSQEPGKKIGEILVEEGTATPAQVDRALQEQQKRGTLDSTVKIPVGKLDSLIEMAGELVITSTQIAQNPLVTAIENPRLINDLGQLGRIVRGLQDVSMSMRMVPVQPTFQKMVRIVRDLSRKIGKNVEIKLSGEDTEIDKNMVELIHDPLVHMVRNAIDHGIELPQDRVSKGKPEQGTVWLSASHKSGNIVVELKDDGQGLNRERILKKARERGLVKDGETPDDTHIYNFIFAPGFSTADKVTDVSGRGVGLDVVKKNVEQLHGRIDMTSVPGQGSTFMIRLPLTLAIIDGIVLKVGKDRYIVPIYNIAEFIKPKKEKMSSVVDRGEVIQAHGILYQVIRLDKFFNTAYENKDVESLVGCLMETETGRVCVLVDELLGQQQVVIKSLEGKFKEIKGLSGATILGDGRVGLILDVGSLVELARDV